VILTGTEIEREVERSRIVIDPFRPGSVEPNSYGFRLSPHLIVYEDEVLDARRPPVARNIELPEDGLVLAPGTLYLGSTVERLGSPHYAATLYARCSVSTMGMWIQYSAPLGHMGAVIAWTLEIRVAHPLVVFPEMPIGKIAFWATRGRDCAYRGRYRGSVTTVASRLAAADGPGGWP